MNLYRFLGRGIVHEDAGKECQDRLSTMTADGGRNILAISDGCSSSQYAGEAAQLNLDVINRIFFNINVDLFSRDALAQLYPALAGEMVRFDRDDVASCLQLIFRYEMAQLARKRLHLAEVSYEDFCATLLFVIREKEKTLVGHIGDGNVVFYDKSGNVVYRSKEDNGSDSTHTFFTVSDSFPERFHCDVISSRSYDSFILFSDGPQTMFQLESDGGIPEGAYDILVKPITSGKIADAAALKLALQEPLSHAMHYGFDDWSIIAGTTHSDGLCNLTNVSLKQMFMETYPEASRNQNTVAPTARNEGASQPPRIQREGDGSGYEKSDIYLEPPSNQVRPNRRDLRQRDSRQHEPRRVTPRPRRIVFGIFVSESRLWRSMSPPIPEDAERRRKAKPRFKGKEFPDDKDNPNWSENK